MKATFISIIIAGIIIGGSIILLKNNNENNINPNSGDSNVYIENGEQIIDITARGGYFPRRTIAQSGISTIIRMKTNNSFDCSIAVSIPSINYRKNLPPTAVTDIEIPAQKSGSTLQGLCAMGMYNFSINFD